MDMARHENWSVAERLQTRLAALKSRIARLPQTAQTEYRPLVDDLEVQLGRPGRPCGEVRRLLDDIRAIDKCVRFELAILSQEIQTRPTEDPSDGQPRLRLDIPATTGPHSHLGRSRTNAAAKDK
jgi:hypothetical protein